MNVGPLPVCLARLDTSSKLPTPRKLHRLTEGSLMSSRFTRFTFLLVGLVGVGGIGIESVPAQESEPQRRTDLPNIVVFLADDQGWGDLSLHGNSNLATPNLDSLAQEGARFDWFYVCAVCAPTRAEFLTGRYYGRTGVRGVSTGAERLNLDEVTLADHLKAAGYTTGAFGKWHNGTQHPYHPNARGFDTFYGFCSGHWGHYFSPPLERNNQIVRGEGYVSDDFTGQAIEFIEQNRDKPFLCYVPYCTPHSPMQVPDEYWDKFADKELAKRHRDPMREEIPKTRAALAMCENIDWNVGRVLKKLEELELTGNTIVVYFSDNGPNSFRWNADMKGRKGSLDEGGLRVPCFIRWPGKIPAGMTVTRIAGGIDLMPTLLDLAEIPLESTKPIDGTSLKPLLLGTARDWADREIISLWNNRLSVRTQRFRLDPAGGLFEIAKDIGQRKNVQEEHPKEAARLEQLLAQFKQEIEPTYFVKEDRPFTVGYSVETPLPARDGVPHGEVKRSAPAPNCSYFTAWKDTEARITWDVEVGQPGEYEVIVYYTCQEANVGVEIQAELHGQTTKGTIDQPHDPPAYGPEADRSPRGGIESDMKDFKPVSLGRLTLPTGRATLTLTAPRIPGDEAIEVRYVWLNRTAAE